MFFSVEGCSFYSSKIMLTVISLYTVKEYISIHDNFMLEPVEGGGGVLPIMTHTGRLQLKGVPSSGFGYMFTNRSNFTRMFILNLSKYYYCIFSHSSQGNSVVRIISWKRPSLVTLLLLKQRELTRQETLCSGNSVKSFYS